jgi:hypothetical protein
MNKIILALFLIAAVSSQAQLSPVITSWIQNPDTTLAANRGYNNIPSNCLKVQYSSTDVYVSCTCIPGYSIGPWNANPNTPINENFVYKFTLNPRKNTGTLTTIGNGHIGVWKNGVSMFNADDAQYVNTIWSRNAYYFEGNSFDACLGHPAPNGEYHHHVSPTCLYHDNDSTHHSPIIGYMFDGYPIYGAYAYADTNGTGGIKRMRSGYRLRADQSRTTKPDGTTASTAGPAVSSTYPMGCLLWDYEWVAGVGDLDSRNGRYCVTPEYPNGTYAYFVTIDSTLAPQFPYTPYINYYGVVQAGNGGGPGGGHNTISGATTVYVDTTATSTGINGTSQISFKIVPNPTQAYVYVYMDNNSTNNVAAKLYDEKGTLLQDLQYMQPTMAYSIDLTKYPAGVYLLHMNDGKQEVVRKIVKQ